MPRVITGTSDKDFARLSYLEKKKDFKENMRLSVANCFVIILTLLLIDTGHTVGVVVTLNSCNYDQLRAFTLGRPFNVVADINYL